MRERPGDKRHPHADARALRLDHAVAAIRRRWGDRALRCAADLLASPPSLSPHAVLSTGSLGLDLLTGGLPRGRLTEIAGQDGSGVEMLGQTALARAQEAGGIILLVDAGMPLDPAALAAAGIDHDRLLLACPTTALDAWSIVEAVCRSDSVDLLLVSLLDLTNAPGATPAVLRRGLTRVAAALRGRASAVLALSTPLSPPSLPAGPPEAVPTIGGPLIAQTAALRILLFPESPRLTPYGTVAALAARAAVVKQHGLPRGLVLPLEFTESGVHRSLEAVTLGLSTGVLTSSPLGLAQGDQPLGRTALRAAALLDGRPALRDDLEHHIRTAWTRSHAHPDVPIQIGVA